MRTAALKWTLIAASALLPAGADAATYSFDFSTVDSVFTVAATLTTADTLNADGGYDVLSLSGTLSGPGGGAISLIANPTQPSPAATAYFMYDNIYFPGGVPKVDAYGILFAAGGYDYELYSTGPEAYYLSSTNPAGGYVPGEAVTFGDPAAVSVAAVPEPSTWVLALLGFAGLALFARRKVLRACTPTVGPARQA
jgi:PEP-CTERM motif-containing protein